MLLCWRSVLQVSVAVLLDSFVSATARIEAEEIKGLLEEKRRRHQAKNPLEPLLKKLTKEYVNNADLSEKLNLLFKVLSICGLCGS
jgi:hypothetical protein